MSNNRAVSREMPTLPTGTEVASYGQYDQAVAAVAALAESQFPLQSVSIVGTDLHMVERVVGKVTPARVALVGAGQGLSWGLLLALMVMLFADKYSVIIPLLAIGAGIGVGMLTAVLSWSGQRGRRSFAAQSQLVATRYALLVSEQTDRAYQLLQGSQGNLNRVQRRRVRRPEASTGPTEYGSRPDEKPRFGVRLSEVSGESAPKPAEDSAPADSPAPEAEHSEAETRPPTDD